MLRSEVKQVLHWTWTLFANWYWCFSTMSLYTMHICNVIFYVTHDLCRCVSERNTFPNTNKENLQWLIIIIHRMLQLCVWDPSLKTETSQQTTTVDTYATHSCAIDVGTLFPLQHPETISHWWHICASWRLTLTSPVLCFVLPTVHSVWHQVTSSHSVLWLLAVWL